MNRTILGSGLFVMVIIAPIVLLFNYFFAGFEMPDYNAGSTPEAEAETYVLFGALWHMPIIIFVVGFAIFITGLAIPSFG